MITEAFQTGEAILWGAIASVGLLTAFFSTAIVAAGMRAADAVARWWKRRYVTEHDVGPDALQLLEELDTHLDQYLVEHPDVAAGFDRLRNVVRDQQEKGGSA